MRRFAFFSSLIVALVLLQGCPKRQPQQKAQGASGATSTTTSKAPDLVKEVKLGPIDAKLAEKGKAIFKSKCTACHRMSKRYVGPAMAGVTERRKPEWIMNMILYPDWMVKHDEIAKKLIAQFAAPMTNLNLSKEDARAILEYLRQYDAKKKEKKAGSEKKEKK